MITDKQIIYQIISGIVIAGIIGYFLFFLSDREYKRVKKSNEVTWTAVEINDATNIFPKKLTHIILGLRNDGVVIWKEENK